MQNCSLGLPGIRDFCTANRYVCGCVNEGEERCIQGFGGETQGKEATLKTQAWKWEDDMKMDLGEVGWGGMDWIDVAQDRDRKRVFVNAVMNLQIP
jgi:hypothetical protein